MSEINSIANGSFVLGNTSATTYQAGPGISITQPSEGTVRISNDETVLWSADVPKDSGTITLSENFNNFEKIGVSFNDDGPDFNYQEFPCSSTNQHIILFGQDCHYENAVGWCLYMKWASFSFDYNGTTMSLECAGYNNIYGTTKGTSTASYPWAKPYKIVGINRISGGNA